MTTSNEFGRDGSIGLGVLVMMTVAFIAGEAQSDWRAESVDVAPAHLRVAPPVLIDMGSRPSISNISGAMRELGVVPLEIDRRLDWSSDEELIEEYQRIGQYAPLAVEAEWKQLVEAYESAAEVDSDDPLSEQEALEAIFRAEGAAVAVADWLRTNCAVEIGPLATIVGAGVTTTVDPATTEP